MPDTDAIHNQHHDEEVVVSDAESVPDNGEDSEPSDADDAPARGAYHCPPCAAYRFFTAVVPVLASLAVLKGVCSSVPR